MVKIQWIGNAFFSLKTEDKLIYIDPWLNGDQGVSMTKKEAIAARPDCVIVTHGHPGHYGRGDSVEIANETGCLFISTGEVVRYALTKGGLRAPYIGIEPGTKLFIDGMTIDMYQAKHPPIDIPFEWKDLPGEPNGIVVIGINGKKILDIGDTDHDAVYEQIAREHEIDAVMLPVKVNKNIFKRDAEIITLLSVINAVQPSKVFIHNRWKPERPAFEAFMQGIQNLALETEVVSQHPGAEIEL